MPLFYSSYRIPDSSRGINWRQRAQDDLVNFPRQDASYSGLHIDLRNYWERGYDQTGQPYAVGLLPCSVVFGTHDGIIEYEQTSGRFRYCSLCNRSNNCGSQNFSETYPDPFAPNDCPCDGGSYGGTAVCPGSTNVSYHDVQFPLRDGWELQQSKGVPSGSCFGALPSDSCVSAFSSLAQTGLGGIVDVAIPEDVSRNINTAWEIIICFKEVVYVYTATFNIQISVDPGDAGIVYYDFYRGGVLISGSTSDRATVTAYAGEYTPEIRLKPRPSLTYNLDSVKYSWDNSPDDSSWTSVSDSDGDGVYVVSPGNARKDSTLYIKVSFTPTAASLSPDFPIKQGIHLFGGWNLGYLEIINSNVEFHFSVSSFSNLPISSLLSTNLLYGYQEILSPIFVRQKYNLPKFGSIARIKDSNLTFYIPHPNKFMDVYLSGIYGTRFETGQPRIIDSDHNLTDDSLISKVNLGKNRYLMSIITFLVSDPPDSPTSSPVDAFASRSIEFSGNSIKVITNSCISSNVDWPHVSYFTLIRKLYGTSSFRSPTSALDYIILPNMFRDNILSGFFYEDTSGSNSALFAAFTGFQYIVHWNSSNINDSNNGFFFFDVSSSITANTLEHDYFVPKNKYLNAFVGISSGSGCSSSDSGTVEPIIIPDSGDTNLVINEGER